MTLYLKYRPRTINDLDLEEVRESLKKILASDNIPHAFLFSGPKGLGKTSAARILAKAVNCLHSKNGEPCNKCVHCKAIDNGSHLDIIEIDAASHRGIDDIRELRESVKLAPASASKKIYIIDEAHMLTAEASNALLKTLEEPPSHVMFILATTNPEKLIDTVRSRATNVLFKKPKVEELMRSLNRVVKGEKMKFQKDQLLNIIESAGGSFRDGVKIIENIQTQGKKYIINSADAVDKIIAYIFQKNSQKALEEVEKSVELGIDTDLFIEKILVRLHRGLLFDMGVGSEKLDGVSRDDLVEFIKLISSSITLMKYSPVAQLPLEVAIIEWCGNSLTVSKKKEIKVEKSAPLEIKEVENDIWGKILSRAKPKNKSIEALLRSAKPISFDGEVLTLAVFYSFHKERLESSHHRLLLDEIIKEVFGKNIKVVCTLAAPPQVTVEKVKHQEGVVLEDALTSDEGGDIIDVAKEMFGG